MFCVLGFGWVLVCDVGFVVGVLFFSVVVVFFVLDSCVLACHVLGFVVFVLWRWFLLLVLFFSVVVAFFGVFFCSGLLCVAYFRTS